MNEYRSEIRDGMRFAWDVPCRSGWTTAWCSGRMIAGSATLSATNWAHHLHPRGGFEGYRRAGSERKWREVHGREPHRDPPRTVPHTGALSTTGTARAGRYSASARRSTATSSARSRWTIAACSTIAEPWNVPGNRCSSTVIPAESSASA
jgi:hypothetical protein